MWVYLVYTDNWNIFLSLSTLWISWTDEYWKTTFIRVRNVFTSRRREQLSLQTRPYNTCVHDAWSRKLVATNQFIDLRLIANKGRFTVIPSKLCRFWIVIPACIYFLFLVIFFFTPNWTTMMNACTRLKNKCKSNQEIVKSGDDFLCYG